MADYEFKVGDASVAVTTERTQFGFTVRLADGEALEFLPVGNGLYSVMRGGQRSIVAAVKHKGVYYVDLDSVQVEVREASDEASYAGGPDASGAKDKIFAPMPGKIVKILVALGDDVTVKQPMVIVEAMKMENQVNAKAKGRVRAINFQAGEQVSTEQPIIELDLSAE